MKSVVAVLSPDERAVILEALQRHASSMYAVHDLILDGEIKASEGFDPYAKGRQCFKLAQKIMSLGCEGD